MNANEGGPFGAVITRKGKIVAASHNLVLSSNDPTAHAEITAIRAACKKLKRFDLSDCEMHSTCEPCPMCLGAILWARIPKVHYAGTRKDAKRAGFADEKMYDELCGKARLETKLVREKCGECGTLFEEWKKKKGRKRY